MEHSATKQLWPNRGRHYVFPLLGLGAKRRSDGVHGADVELVGLPYSALLPGSLLCVICALLCWGPMNAAAPIHP